MHCLLIEDDFATAHSTKLALRVREVTCDIAFTGYEGIQYAESNHYDIILLDMILPDIDGMEVIHTLRQQHIQTPIIVLSSMTQIDYKIRALQLGADDYITKPYDSNELIARIRVVINRCFRGRKSISQIGLLTVDFSNNLLKVKDTYVKLTDMEFKLLELLALKQDSILTKETIGRHLYGCIDAVPNRIINVFVCRLRKKLEKVSGGLNFIQTSWGGGYQLLPFGIPAAGESRSELFAKKKDAG